MAVLTSGSGGGGSGASTPGRSPSPSPGGSLVRQQMAQLSLGAQQQQQQQQQQQGQPSPLKGAVKGRDSIALHLAALQVLGSTCCRLDADNQQMRRNGAGGGGRAKSALTYLWTGFLAARYAGVKRSGLLTHSRNSHIHTGVCICSAGSFCAAYTSRAHKRNFAFVHHCEH